MTPAPPTILAQIQAERWPELVRIWRDPSHGFSLSTGTVVLSLGGLVLALAALLWGVERLRSRRRPHPLALFRRVALDMGLDGADRRLLIRIARQQGLPSPLTLLVSSATFAHHVRAYAQTRQGGGGGRLRGQAARLGAKLFPDVSGAPGAVALPEGGGAD